MEFLKEIKERLGEHDPTQVNNIKNHITLILH